MPYICSYKKMSDAICDYMIPMVAYPEIQDINPNFKIFLHRTIIKIHQAVLFRPKT